jgi:organic anion transporter 4A/organic anion transporter 4C
MMGAVFDSTCVVWQEKCGGRGSCWVYDSVQLGFRVFIMAVIVKLMGAMFFTMTLCFYKAPIENTDTSLSDNTEETTDSVAAVIPAADKDVSSDLRPG